MTKYLITSALTSICLFGSILPDDATFDATELSLDQLLSTDYIPASHIANQINNAASAVSIVTAQDIHDYGYRTLGEILGSMRGVHTFEDYEYTYLGGRGYGVPGDYAGRIIVLIDGYRADDSFYGQAYLGEDGILDVSLIERVEYIPGGNSAGYANGALLGVINIVTKNADAIGGTKVTLGYGSYKSHALHVSYGSHFDNGIDIIASASKFHSEGRDFTYKDNDDIPITQRHQHGTDNRRLFFKLGYDALSFESGWVWCTKNIPSYPLYGVFDEHADTQKDTNGFARLKYDNDLSANLKLSSSLWYGTYRYNIRSPYPIFEDGPTGFEGESHIQWFGGDLKLIGTWFDAHTLSMGMEYRYDYDAMWQGTNFDLTSGDPLDKETVSYKNRRTYSAYLYDEFRVMPTVTLSAGIRYETSNLGYRVFSPQAAFIWNIYKNTTFKLSAGETNRQTTVYEGLQSEPERARMAEIVLDQRFDDESRLLLSGYRYHIFDYSTWLDIPAIDTEGFEAEFEKHWLYGSRLRASYAWQHSVQMGQQLANTPLHMAKFNASLPLHDDKLRMGFELRYIGERPDNDGNNVASHLLGDATFTSKEWLPSTNISFKISNLADTHYGDIIWPLYDNAQQFPQQGRTFWVNLGYTFQ